MQDLPRELLFKMMGFLPVAAVGRIGLTCRLFHAISLSEASDRRGTHHPTDSHPLAAFSPVRLTNPPPSTRPQKIPRDLPARRQRSSVSPYVGHREMESHRGPSFLAR